VLMNEIKSPIFYACLFLVSALFIAGFTRFGEAGASGILGASIVPFAIGAAMARFHSRASGVVAVLAVCFLMLIGSQ